MEDGLAPRRGPHEAREVGDVHVTEHDVEAVRRTPVDHDDLMAGGQQPVDHVGPDEPRAPRHRRPHAGIPATAAFTLSAT